MSYKTMEQGLETVIKLHADYIGTTPVNVSRGDYRILGHGTNLAVILQPGGIFKRDIVAAPRRQQTIWVTIIELWVGFRGEITNVADDVRVKRQNLIDHLDKYPTLNNTAGCINAFLREGNEPVIMPGDPMRWWMQTLRMYIEERSTITIAE